jgi:quinol-cytochrome oxidoreductase complex cytochrome b subunit
MNFYVLHTTFLPLAFLMFLPFHFWRVRKAGGLVVPREPEEVLEGKGTYVTTIPHLVVREAVTALVLFAAVFLFAVFFNAPLGNPANPGMSPNPAKAPWYFLGLQELVHYGALIGGVVVPTAMILGLLALPYVDRKGGGVGGWFARERRTANTVFALLALAVIVLTFVGTFFRGPNWDWVWPWVR